MIIGMETAQLLEIVSGLQEHDVVLVGRRNLVKPGMKVQAKRVEISTQSAQ